MPASTRFVWDKHALYELCAQNPPRDARLLRAIHADARVARGSASGLSNLTLAEDFCGTGALSRAWCDLCPTFRAIATDIDGPTLAVAGRLSAGQGRVCFRRADVRTVTSPADLIAVLNFSICEIHERRALVAYLRRARARLARPPTSSTRHARRGVFICDLYGGADAYQTGLLDQTVRPPRDHPAHLDRILYSWEQRSADPLTARVVNAMHFDARPPKGRPQVFLNAFVYHWRLWTIAELREAMLEAGFVATHVYQRTAGATDSDGNLYTLPIEDATELGDSYNVFIAAATAPLARREDR